MRMAGKVSPSTSTQDLGIQDFSAMNGLPMAIKGDHAYGLSKRKAEFSPVFAARYPSPECWRHLIKISGL